MFDLTNKRPMAHGAGEEIVAAMAGIVDKLQQVAVGFGKQCREQV